MAYPLIVYKIENDDEFRQKSKRVKYAFVYKFKSNIRKGEYFISLFIYAYVKTAC